MVDLARPGPVVPVVRSRSWVAGSHLMARTRTMTHLASGQTEEAGTGTDQGNAVCHSCSAGRLLVVAAYHDLVVAYPDLAAAYPDLAAAFPDLAAANLDLAREAVPEVGLEAERGPLVQEPRSVVGACEVVYAG